MTDPEAAAAEVLAGFQPIGNDHPRVRDFGEAVAAHVAVRPSPNVSEPSQADRIEQKLDEVLLLLRGGADK
jgi:hypothetical protein